MSWIILTITYRDAQGHAHNECVYFENKNDLNTDEVLRVINEKIGIEQQFIAEDYFLPNIAPTGNEYIDIGETDSAYIAIEGIDKELKNTYPHGLSSEITDISDWINAVSSVTKSELKRNAAQRKMQAIEHYASRVAKLAAEATRQ